MTVESQNPYQSPAVIDQSDEVVEVPGIILALGRAAGLGLLGIGAFATPSLVAYLAFGALITHGAMLTVISYSVAIGWVFAASEILRIGPVMGKFETANRVLWSGGLMVVSYFGVLLLHSHVSPGWFPIGPHGLSVETVFWIIVVQTMVVYLMLMWGGRQVVKWWVQTGPQPLISESSPEVADDDLNAKPVPVACPNQ